MEEIVRRFCAYCMELEQNEGYTPDWVTLLPEIQLAYNRQPEFYNREITLSGREGVEPLTSYGSLEENPSNHPPHRQSLP
ncbi:hypothetical protein O181_047449 [Austropuccinia psidii MF-1]|uniref:Uncharacterized protein n=1 Tax=Austropuccinia psidii MF-1 TaxID=1389203 RepID=A0A9Q3DR20_9BASI|nr:hypothetical protein [Austropuccinia psidii MF-1]